MAAPKGYREATPEEYAAYMAEQEQSVEQAPAPEVTTASAPEGYREATPEEYAAYVADQAQAQADAQAREDETLGRTIGRNIKEGVGDFIEGSKAYYEVPNAMAGGALGLAHGYADGFYTAGIENPIQRALGLDEGETGVQAKNRRRDYWARPPESENGKAILKGIDWVSTPLTAVGDTAADVSRELSANEDGEVSDFMELIAQATGDVATSMTPVGTLKAAAAAGRGTKAAAQGTIKATQKAKASPLGQKIVAAVEDQTTPTRLISTGVVSTAVGSIAGGVGVAPGLAMIGAGIAKAGWNKRNKGSTGTSAAELKTAIIEDAASAVGQRVGAKGANKLIGTGGRNQNRVKGKVQAGITNQVEGVIKGALGEGKGRNKKPSKAATIVDDVVDESPVAQSAPVAIAETLTGRNKPKKRTKVEDNYDPDAYESSIKADGDAANQLAIMKDNIKLSTKDLEAVTNMKRNARGFISPDELMTVLSAAGKKKVQRYFNNGDKAPIVTNTPVAIAEKLTDKNKPKKKAGDEYVPFGPSLDTKKAKAVVREAIDELNNAPNMAFLEARHKKYAPMIKELAESGNLGQAALDAYTKAKNAAKKQLQ